MASRSHIFEDFLMMHTPLYGAWVSQMQTRGHFDVPLHSQDYLPIFRSYFPDYRKGSLPFELNRELVCRMLENNRKHFSMIRSDFAAYLDEELQAGLLHWF